MLRHDFYVSQNRKRFPKSHFYAVSIRKNHTIYKRSQRQRGLERTLQKQKWKILVDEKTGDKEKFTAPNPPTDPAGGFSMPELLENIKVGDQGFSQDEVAAQNGTGCAIRR